MGKKLCVSVFGLLIITAMLCDCAAQKEAVPIVAKTIAKQTRQSLERMLPVYVSILQAMRATGKAYSFEDAGFVWNVLYQLTGRYGAGFALVEEDGDHRLRVPRKMMQELATETFGAYTDTDLPDLVKDVPIRYDYDWDAYLMEKIDTENGSARITSIQKDGEDRYTVIVQWTGNEQESAVYRFTVGENPYRDAINDPQFPLSVFASEKVA